MKSGWFSEAEREIFKLDPVMGMESGVTRTDRALMLPERPYQVLAETNPAGLSRRAQICRRRAGPGPELPVRDFAKTISLQEWRQARPRPRRWVMRLIVRKGDPR